MRTVADCILWRPKRGQIFLSWSMFASIQAMLFINMADTASIECSKATCVYMNQLDDPLKRSQTHNVTMFLKSMEVLSGHNFQNFDF